MTLTATEAADLFRRDPDRLIDVGAGKVAVRTVGTGPDVLFVHGWPVTGATFRKLLPHLTPHVTCHLIDLVGTGSSDYDERTPVGIEGHVEAVRRVVDELGLTDVAVVGHDSGGMIARHALAGDERVRSMVMIDTELPDGLSWRFTAFIRGTRLPGFGKVLGWVVGRRRLRRFPLVLGGAFVDNDLLDGEFDEFFLRPLHTDPVALAAGVRIVDSFEQRFVTELADLHRRIEVPVHLVWGRHDPFFPVDRARDHVADFADARLTVIDDASLFSHEERPAEVATAILATVR
ncbi:pimeloyl-ACP methyl ester carboxylesterase [Ilumatobacter fluminis]|uniref:Pimeloyl-ACP methyl ester carboxylesterase n=1 Tax=Ilumatobacter fluminis TaxID=467091 RepID=A0A4R7HWH8_9ACTN|nr:alpha/beta hydrolase [Ilumatobacter fluminis]TDT14493.1 pimeloyl-ACP methyl ester carboxylesterase [Ilumatobacter fluminis]